MNNGVYKNRQLEGAMSQVGGYAGMTGGVEQTLIGAYGFIKADQMRKKYNRQAVPQYTEDPSMTASRRRAEESAKFGYSPEQRSSFFNNLSRLNNSRQIRALSAGGGNASAAVNAGINYGNIGALNTYAMNDAALHRSNIQYADAFSRNLQALRNMNTQKDYAAYIDKGRAIAQMRDNSLKNLVGGAQTFAGGSEQIASASGSDAQQYQSPQQNTMEAPVNYEAGNSGYNQGYNRNQWLYGFANRGQDGSGAYPASEQNYQW